MEKQLSTSSAGGRSVSLDGLRGLAAAVVVLHHTLLVHPEFAAGYYGLPSTGLARFMTFSPLHVVWGGTEAVYLFFVLSGLVLARSAARPGFDWGRYFPSRMARLYLPVFGAVLLAAVVYVVLPRADYAGESPWMSLHPLTYPVNAAILDSAVVTGASGAITPLWSLQWEVLFSLALGAYLAFSRRAHLGLQLAAAMVLICIGMTTGVVAFQYLPMFAVGTALGSNWEAVSAAMRRFSTVRGSGWWWALAVAVALLIIPSYWVLQWAVGGPFVRVASAPLIMLGVVTVVLAAAWWPPLYRLLSSRFFRWLGTVSFSLYLVHEPIVVGFGFISQGAWWGSVVGIIVSFVVAQGFWWLVERPAHALARRLNAAPQLAS